MAENAQANKKCHYVKIAHLGDPPSLSILLLNAMGPFLGICAWRISLLSYASSFKDRMGKLK
jgi:hypothetical protein